MDLLDTCSTRSADRARVSKRGWRAPRSAGLIAILSFFLLPSLAEAAPVAAAGAHGTLSRDTVDIARLDGPRQVANARTWELIRESSQRLLEPDTRMLRYMSRYTVNRELANKIVEEATAAGIDPELAFRLVRVESRFQSRARSPAGALGLTQLMPSTARALDRSLRSESDILEPRTNLRLGFGYLREMIERYGGDVRLGLLAYNRGPGTVDRVLRQGRDPENGYSRKVLGTGFNRYTGDGILSGNSAR
jgi:soluble lytic murein transglycosylase-like protein